MSDIEISSGGAIAVDTVLLRAMADAIERSISKVDSVESEFFSAQRWEDEACVVVSGPSNRDRFGPVRALRDAASGLARDVRESANTYELAELLITQSVREFSSTEQARFTELADDQTLRLLTARVVIAQWRQGAVSGLTDAYDGAAAKGVTSLGSSALLTTGAAVLAVHARSALVNVQAFLRVLGHGSVRSGQKLAGPPPPVAVAEVSRSTAGRAPTTLTDVVDRIPMTGDARVVVEKYSAPGQSNRFIAYVAGTRGGGEDSEAWDWAANAELYLQQSASASSEATLAALREAGAEPGDQVIVSGYSQGALITSNLAVDSPYDVVASIDIGSPVEAELGEDVLKVSLAHDDDLVAALASGGVGTTTGSPDSVVITRTALENPDLWEIPRAHGIDEYRETAALADESGASQITKIHETLGAFTAGATVTTYGFSAKKVDP